MNKKNNISKNIITSFLVQIVVTIQGLIMPRIILTYFGSAINGLVSSLTQCLNLFAIVEGGISGVILSALYKPITENNNDKLSSILVSANNFMKKLGVIFAIYSIVLATLYPIFIKEYSWKFTFSLTIIIGITIFIQYFFVLIPQLLLRADDKFYLCNYVQIIFIVLNILFATIFVKIFPEIRFLKIISSIVYLIQPFLLITYIKKNFNINWNAKKDKNLLKQRWDGFGISLANLVTTNTDIIILTIFTSLSIVSVYTIYSQILIAIKSLINSISNGFQAQIGQLYVKKNFTELKRKFFLYESVTNIISGLFITCCAEVIVPFVMIYTKGIKDVNYNVPIFASMITLSTLFLCIREPYIQLTYCAGYFKQTAKYAYIEAILNIVLSIILVIKFGLIGVTIGTIASVLYRYFYTVVFIRKKIFDREISLFLKQFFVLMMACVLAYGISIQLNLFKINTFFLWIIRSCICMIINTVIFLSVYYLFYKEFTKEIIRNIFDKLR